MDELLKGIQIGACVFSLYRQSHLINIAAAMAACNLSHLYARSLVIVVPSRTHNVSLSINDVTLNFFLSAIDVGSYPVYAPVVLQKNRAHSLDRTRSQKGPKNMRPLCKRWDSEKARGFDTILRDNRQHGLKMMCLSTPALP